MRCDTPGDRSHDDQPVRLQDALQDGGSSHSAGSAPSRLLDDHNRSGRCFSPRAIAPIASAELPIQTEWKAVSVASDAFWLSRCPTHIHEDDACDCASGASTGSTDRRVSGRHPSDGGHRGTVSEGHDRSDRNNHGIRSADECKEIKAHSEPDSHVSGSHSRLSGDGLPSSTREDLGHSKADETDSEECVEVSPGWGKNPSENRGQTAVNLSLREGVQIASQQPDRSPALSRGIRVSSIGASSSQRPPLVGRGTATIRKSTDPIQFSGFHLRHGRIGNGLGSSLLSAALGPKRTQGLTRVSPKSRMLGSLDRGNDFESKRTDSNLAISSISDKTVELEKLLSSRANRQSDFHVPHQQDGRTSSSTVADCSEDPPLCIGSRIELDSRISAGRVERRGGSPLASGAGFLPIPDQSPCLPHCEQVLGSVHTGLLRVRSELSSSPIRELSHGSGLPVHGLPISSSGSERNSLVSSTICSDRQVVEQSSRRTAGDHAAVPAVASSAVVADHDCADGRLADHRSTGFQHVNDEKSERKVVRHSEVEHSARETIGKALEKRGMAPDTISSVFEKWKNGGFGPTVKKFNSKFATFCESLAIIGGDEARPRAMLLEPTDVANVMTFLINKKKQKPDTIRGFLSALDSMKKLMFPESPRLGEDPTLSGIVKGHRRKNPKTDKRLNSPSEYFSVFRMYENFPKKIHLLSLIELRDAIIPILALDLLARSSDLYSIDRESMKFHTINGVKAVSFDIIYPKESKEDCRKACTLESPKSGLADCVAALQMYHDKTRSLTFQLISKGTQDDYIPLFVKVPSELQKKDREKSIVPAIGKDRISNILKKAILATASDPSWWTGHATRGAAVSKLFNMGVDSARWAVYGRWASNQTAVETYLKRVVYQNVPKDIREWKIVDVLRYNAKRIDNGGEGSSK